MAAAQTQPLNSASLYVGDLVQDVTEAVLYDVFNAVGPVASIRVCRDSVTRRSLGYAYVNYHNAQDAERALDTLNYTTIKDQTCRIMWSHRDPALRKSGTGNIFVKNLDKAIDNKALYDTFSLFGNILSCKVANDTEGKSLGYGFVHYETEEAAKTAIEKVDNMSIGTKTVTVCAFKKRTERNVNRDEMFTNVYVKSIPDEWSQEFMKEMFSQYGEITSCVVNPDKHGRKYGFVNFEKPEEAKAAIDALHEKATKDDGIKSEEEVAEEQKRFEEEAAKKKAEKSEEKPEGEESSNKGDDEKDTPPRVNRLYVQRAQPKFERMQILKQKFDPTQNPEKVKKFTGVNLYIKNLDDTMDDEKLRETFEQFGTVQSAKVMMDDKGVSRGFGFVSFGSPDEATKAVQEMHLRKVNNKPLYVGLAERRDQRLARLQQRYRLPGGPGGPMGPMGQRPGPMMPGAGPMGAQQPIFAGQPGAAPQFLMGMGGPRGPMPGMYPGFPNPMAGGWARGQQGAGGRGMPMGGPAGMPMGMQPGAPLYPMVPPMGAMGGAPMGMPSMGGAQFGAGPAAGGNRGNRMQGGRGGMGPQGGRGGNVPAGGMMAGPNGKGPMGQQGAGPQQPGGYKLTAQARNQRVEPQQAGLMGAMGMGPMGGMHPLMAQGMHAQQGPAGQQQPAGPGMPFVSQDEPLTAATLAAADPPMQKQMLGEKLFPLIHKMQRDLAGKITGMMLEMDNAELLILLESEKQLQAKVDEALRVLEQAGAGTAE